MSSNIDFLIVGAGIYGATIGRLLTDTGYKCLIVDKRKIVGGNCADFPDDTNSYYVGFHGPHVFHTSNEGVKSFVTAFSKFNHYDHKVIAKDSNDNLYTLPINYHTLYDIYKMSDIEKIKERLINEQDAAKEKYGDRTDFEAIACKTVGGSVYDAILKEYTEKQWGQSCDSIPGELFNRINIDFSFNTKYFKDSFVGMPENGYSKLIQNIIEGVSNGERKHESISCITDVDVLKDKKFWFSIPRIAVIYCGAPDKLMNYKLGELGWRSLSFGFGEYDYNGTNGQGIAVMNYVSKSDSYTRVTDYLHFYKDNIDFGKLPIKGIMSIEGSMEWKHNLDPYYPINTKENNELYNKYVELINEKHRNVFLGGRLGKYKYLDMDDAVMEAMKDFKYICSVINNEGSTE